MHRRAIAALLFLLLHGCVSAYAPPGPVVPLLDERGDLSVAANFRPFFPTRGANAYIAAAPTEALRLFLSGSLTRYSGAAHTDYAERRMRERNHTTQLEGALGWGLVQGRRVFELFAGLGYGRSSAHQCSLSHDIHYGSECKLWIDSESWFLRPFVQAHVGRRYQIGATGGGVRVSAVSYFYERLLGEPSDRVGSALTFEPFVSQSFGWPWGKLELQFQLPMVLLSSNVRYSRSFASGTIEQTGTWRERLVETASPRFTIGVRADLDELWRDR